MKIRVYSRGGTDIDADGEYQEPMIREAIDQRGDVASVIVDYTDSERSDISHDEYAVVTGDGGLELWRGWLTGDPAEAPPAEAAHPSGAVVAAVDLLFRYRHELDPSMLRSLQNIWHCASAARYGRPYEDWDYGPEFYATHDDDCGAEGDTGDPYADERHPADCMCEQCLYDCRKQAEAEDGADGPDRDDHAGTPGED